MKKILITAAVLGGAFSMMGVNAQISDAVKAASGSSKDVFVINKDNRLAIMSAAQVASKPIYKQIYARDAVRLYKKYGKVPKNRVRTFRNGTYAYRNLEEIAKQSGRPVKVYSWPVCTNPPHCAHWKKH